MRGYLRCCSQEGMVASGLFRYKDFIDFIKDQSTASL